MSDNIIGCVYKYQLGCEPKFRGWFDEFSKDYAPFAIGEEVAEGLREIIFPEPASSRYLLELIPYAMQKYAEEIDAELFDVLNSPDLEAPDQ